MASVMRAIRVAQFGGPEVLRVVKDAVRPAPAAREVLIKVLAAGVNPVDTYIRSGNYPVLPELPYTPGADVGGVIEEVGQGVTKFQVLVKVMAAAVNPADTYIRSNDPYYQMTHKPPSLPYTPGFDMAGLVTTVGDGVTSFKPGDRVYTVRTLSGSYAEFALAAEDMTFHLHDKMTFTQGAAIGVPYFTAFRALMYKGQAKAGDTILVHGASGGVGLAACQLGRAYGMRVLGTAGTNEGMNLINQMGASAFNHNAGDYARHIMETTGGAGVDVILEMLANKNLNTDLELLAPGGRVVIIGSRGNIEINPRLTMGKETTIVGCALMKSTPEEFSNISSALWGGMDAGFVQPVIGGEYPLHAADRAHHDIINNLGTKGKIILTIGTG